MSENVPQTIGEAMTELVTFMQEHWPEEDGEADRLFDSEPVLEEISKALTNLMWIGDSVASKMRHLSSTDEEYVTTLNNTTQLVYSVSIALFIAARSTKEV